MWKKRNPTDTNGSNNAKDRYNEAFPFLTSSKKGLAFAYCLAFEKDFTRAH